MSTGHASLKSLSIRLRMLSRALFRTANAPAAIALLVVVVAGIYADHQNRVLARQALRSDVLKQVGVIRAKLEGNITGNIQLVRGLVATLATEPGMSQMRFGQLVQSLFLGRSQLKTVAAAPDLVVRMVYPREGNEKVLGLDYRKNDRQRDAALRARDSGDMVLAGPVDLVQGGTGFVARFPVFIGEDASFWGIVSAVVDAPVLYRDSGLLDDDLSIDIALTGIDALGAKGAQFFGAPEITRDDPVTADVVFPTGTWRIAAVPKGGWDAMPAGTWLLRFAFLVAGILIVVPVLVSGRLVEERQKHVRERRRRDRQFELLSRRLELALDASQIGVWELDLDNHDVLWDDRIRALYGKPPNHRAIGYEDWVKSVHPDDVARAVRDFNTARESGNRYASEFRIVRSDGQVRHIRARGTIHRGAGVSPKMIGAEWDVTADVLLNKDLERARDLAERHSQEIEAAKARIEHNALHDSLTGLPNRRYLDEVLERQGQGSGQQTALLHIDLDRFKQINDTLGHAAGDAMLVHAAAVLKSKVRAEDFVARIGGDEFVVLCGSTREAGDLAALADRIIVEMHKPVPYKGHQCRFGVSVGIAVDQGESADPRQLLVNADIALYRAKSRGRNRHEFFTEALQAEIVHTKTIADDILNGLERGEFVTYYQPQLDARTLEIVGMEALSRWNHPRLGILSPDAFLSIAEELNVVATIDRIVLEQSLAHLDEWEAAGLVIPRVSVNVSARRLQDEDLIHSLNGLAIKPGRLSFELVESIFLDENDAFVAWNIDQIKDLGIDIEIDDFGTGYASIVSLLKLKPRRLKIDRQLIMPIVRSATQRHLVESIIEIGKSLGVEVVAEGVESMEHARILKDLGCDILQGYAFARPLSPTDLAEFVRARRWRAAS